MAASYEVTDGTKILGTFSSQAKADALKKELKAKGIVAHVLVSPLLLVKSDPYPFEMEPNPPRYVPPKFKPNQPAMKYVPKIESEPVRCRIYGGDDIVYITSADIDKQLPSYEMVCDGKYLGFVTSNGSYWFELLGNKAPAKPKAIRAKTASKPKKAPKEKRLTDMVLDSRGGSDGTYLFNNGLVGKFVDMRDIDWDYWSDAEYYDDDNVLVRAVGIMCFLGLYGPNGEYIGGFEAPYYEGMTLGDFCDGYEIPKPKTKIPDEFFEVLEADCDPKMVFKTLKAYLSGKYSDGQILEMLQYGCKPSASRNLRRRYRPWPHHTK